MEIYQHKHFANALRQMRQQGGQRSKVVKDVEALLYRIVDGGVDPFDGMPTTNHGESRLKHCVKYDLQYACRLVTVQTNGCRILLYVGSHDDTDRWLDSHKGLAFVTDDANRVATTAISMWNGNERISGEADNALGLLIDRLPEEVRLALQEDLTLLEGQYLLKVECGATNEEIERAVGSIRDLEKQIATFDVLTLLNQGKVEEAINRVKLLKGEVHEVDTLPESEILKIRSGTEIKKIPIGSAEYKQWLQNYIESEHPFDWFLFMHPEQEAYVEANYNGPAKLSGVSGSGKTSIAIRRAIRLAGMYPSEKVLVLTLNRALADLISEIVNHACRDASVRSRIEVKSMFSLAQELLRSFEPANARLYSDTTWRLEEHKDEVYREYYRCLNNVLQAEAVLPTHRLLLARGVDAEKYISEEFDWIRSATTFSKRDEYLTMQRKGRGLPLDPEQREHVLKGLSGWEQKMRDVGVVDHMGLITALSQHASSLKPLYRSIIVDEVQDFGTTELQIVRALVAPAENDLFMCGDAAQLILPKHQIMAHAGIDTAGRSFKISRNYRNSREILECAHKILFANLSEQHFDNSELEISDPQYASRSSAAPIVLKANSLQQEIGAAIRLLKENVEFDKDKGKKHTGCIAIAGYSQFEVSQLGLELDAKVLDSEKNFLDDQLFLSDLEQTKGYEFDTMIVVNCTSTALPPEGVAEDEVYRNASQLYVAITRAKNQVILSYSGQPSKWLENPRVGLSFDEWENFVSLEGLPEVAMPGFLPEFPDQDTEVLRSLTGRQFLYTPYARGFDVELQARIEDLIDGSGLRRDGKRIKWKNIGVLLDDYDRFSGTQRVFRVFGKYDDLVRERLTAAIQGVRPVMRRKQTVFAPSALQATVGGNGGGRIVPPPPRVETNQTTKARQSGPSLEDLSALNLSPRHLGILHSCRIRTPTELVSNSSTLDAFLTKAEIRTLVQRASSVIQESRQRPGQGQGHHHPSNATLIREIGFEKRIWVKLNNLGIMTVGQLKSWTLADLKASTWLSAGDILQIQRVTAGNGIEFKS
jgi:superfamily I DNA/RNA helicase